LKKGSRVSLAKFPQAFNLILVLFVLIGVLSFLSPRFFRVSNFININAQVSVLAIVAIGETFVILTGGIDLGVGSVLGLIAVLMAGLMTQMGIPTVFAIILGLLIGAGLGMVNALWITKAKIPPFIATLAMLSIARGFVFVYTKGYPIHHLPPSFLYIGRGRIHGVPVSMIVVVLLYIIAHIILTYTRFGRGIYAIGGNEPAARLSGLPVTKYKSLVYIICGMMACLGGWLNSARLGAAVALGGIGLELEVIAAVIVGGTSLFGGEGKVYGTLIGALIMAVVRNGLNLLGVHTNWQQVVIGAIVLLAVTFDTFRKRKALVQV
jgi:ribose transport system permease protein